MILVGLILIVDASYKTIKTSNEYNFSIRYSIMKDRSKQKETMIKYVIMS